MCRQSPPRTLPASPASAACAVTGTQPDIGRGRPTTGKQTAGSDRDLQCDGTDARRLDRPSHHVIGLHACGDLHRRMLTLAASQKPTGSAYRPVAISSPETAVCSTFPCRARQHLAFGSRPFTHGDPGFHHSAPSGNQQRKATSGLATGIRPATAPDDRLDHLPGINPQSPPPFCRMALVAFASASLTITPLRCPPLKSSPLLNKWV